MKLERYIILLLLVTLAIEIWTIANQKDCPAEYYKHKPDIIKPSTQFDPFKIRTIWI